MIENLFLHENEIEKIRFSNYEKMAIQYGDIDWAIPGLEVINTTGTATIDGDLLEQLLIAIANNEFPYPNGGFITQYPGYEDEQKYDEENEYNGEDNQEDEEESLTDEEIDYYDWYQQHCYD